MLIKSFVRNCRRYIHRDVSITNEISDKNKIEKIRNIGILAHIDAGKTTTTERILYYSGLIKNMGEVHHGNTVTDYMEQERQRGITITSAAVTFHWKGYRLNLIDTPGHIDFTMEVEQTLRVLDGAVVVLDGSAGVEAQTLTVCRQADRYRIPRIIYVNKMDRSDANFDECLKSIEIKLHTNALAIQYPIKKGSVLEGLVDIIGLQKLIFDKRSQGMSFTKTKLDANEDKDLLEIVSEKREALVDKLSNLDDQLANKIIEQESLNAIAAQELSDSLRRVTLSLKGVPVLLGSSYKNVGVQPLMDSVILYLPHPKLNSLANMYTCFKEDLAARVFKIVHDKQRGPVTFLRIYNGTMKKGEKLYNIQKQKSEQAARLYVVCADDYEEVQEIGTGNIVAATGLKSTITGDLLTTSASAMNHAQKVLQQTINKPEDVLFSGAIVPDPVFFCSIEPPSLSKQLALETALQELEREDPSLKVSYDEETGQTVLAGMGELHIEVIKERIKSEYKIDVDTGPLQIAYKETILNAIRDSYVSEHKIGNNRHIVSITMSVIPNYEESKEILQFDKTQEAASNIANIHPKTMAALKKGVKVALSHGPMLGCPVINVIVKLHFLEVGRGTSDSMISAAVSQCIKQLMQKGGGVLLEPIMTLEIVMPEEYASAVLADLGHRRAEIQNVTVRGQSKVIVALTPLAELMGYSTSLRIITSGTANFSLVFAHYRSMKSGDQEQAIKRITGF